MEIHRHVDPEPNYAYTWQTLTWLLTNEKKKHYKENKNIIKNHLPAGLNSPGSHTIQKGRTMISQEMKPHLMV